MKTWWQRMRCKHQWCRQWDKFDVSLEATYLCTLCGKINYYPPIPYER